MATVFDVPGNVLISKVKDELKKIEQLKPPVWSKFVKTGSAKKKPPETDEFWYWRGASILRQLYISGKPVGVQRLRTKYGSKNDKGRKPARFRKSGGSIIRKLFQQLETAGLVKKSTEQGKKGRSLTPKGKSILDKEASRISKESKK
jgi:small subunit ribosomal protein S19e